MRACSSGDRASGCGPGGRRFNSCQAHHPKSGSSLRIILRDATEASSAYARFGAPSPENTPRLSPCLAFSGDPILVRMTKFSSRICRGFCAINFGFYLIASLMSSSFERAFKSKKSSFITFLLASITCIDLADILNRI